MELWIRTQNKDTLCRVEVLYIGKDTNKIFCDKVITDVSVGFCLGEYKTKERALEVLDEIQNNIRSKYTISLKPERAFDGVYEMPEE